MEELHLLLNELKDENKIGEGTYRDVYQVSPELCAKKLKSTHVKNYYFFSVQYPTKFYSLFKFGISDFNEFEASEYQRIAGKIPNELKDSFAHIREVVEGVLFQDLIKDSSGNTSRRLVQREGGVDDKAFWYRMSQLKEFFLDEDILNFNLKPDNILVMEQNSGEAIPVILDYKRIGPRTYPFQPQLRIHAVAQQKLIRRFERLAGQYKTQ